MSLQNQTISGVFWNFSQRFSTLLIQFIIITIIARILSPADFGMIGMLSIFSSLGLVILDSGFGQALIRNQEVNQDDLSTIFFVQLFLGITIYIILFLLSPAIADFFDEPSLIMISRYVFLIFPINSLGMIHMTLVRKRLKFKLMAKISIVSVSISGIIGVISAYNDLGVWALVIQMVIRSLLDTLILWIVIRWGPSLTFKSTSIQKYLGFSFNLLVTGVMKVISRNIYTLLIGKFYPVAQVGFYNQAKRFEQIPSESLTAVIQNVSYPILSTIQNDIVRLKNGYRKIITQTMLVNLFVMFTLFAIADNLFIVLLTDKWTQSIPYFKILCFYGMLYPLHSINTNILKVRGKGKTIVILEVVRNIILAISIIITINESVFILLFASVITTFISVIINMYYSGKEIDYGIKEQTLDFVPILLIFGTISVLVMSINLMELSNLLKLSIQIPVMIILSALICEIFKINSYRSLKILILEKYKQFMLR
ncbi:MAG: lipopolysaccharide biosynthesis protein [Candidatus Delongbacteria bacterium]|jgi:O-antigen/teichoic acid export membrane protein|nr:lipopolysaccharide biosynthesis protein [Candidatus Delongbacteria bacterium]